MTLSAKLVVLGFLLVVIGAVNLFPSKAEFVCFQLEIPPREREYMAVRESHPPNVWQRICVDGESWVNAKRGCE
jgi:hypothetical protein